jgi:uncharacterized protein RhaS with RHS repeats
MWRYYAPNTGRFFQEDPIGFAGGDDNLYQYVFDNPERYTDPLGLYGWDKSLVDAGNIFAGFGDTLTSGFGLSYKIGFPSMTEAIRDELTEEGFGDNVNKHSVAYSVGRFGGYAWGTYAGAGQLARVQPHMPLWLRFPINNRWCRIGPGKWPRHVGKVPRISIGPSPWNKTVKWGHWRLP